MSLYTFDIPQPVPAENAPITELSQYLERYSNTLLDCVDEHTLRRSGVDLNAHLDRDFADQSQLLHRLHSIL